MYSSMQEPLPFRCFDDSGAFTSQFARQRMRDRGWAFDDGLAKAIKERIERRVAFDFGAGIGLYCHALNCRGVDGIAGIAAPSQGRVLEGNLTDPQLVVPPHDVALCLETAEHIPRKDESVLLGHLTRQANDLILSWGRPDQPGIGHVNGRTNDEVTQLMAGWGFQPDEQLSNELRTAAHISWLKQNVRWFVRFQGKRLLFPMQNGVEVPREFTGH